MDDLPVRPRGMTEGASTPDASAPRGAQPDAPAGPPPDLDARGAAPTGTSAAGRVPPPGGTPPPSGPPPRPQGAGLPPHRPEPGPEPAAPGLREQLDRTRGAAIGLLRAHVDLARAELGEIADHVKRAIAFGGVALGLVMFAGMLAGIGSILWLGEWWFGSIGWGALLGTELFLALAVAFGLMAVWFGGGRVVRDFVIGVVIGAIVAVVLGLNLTNRGWTALADALALGIAPEWRILVPAVVATAIVLGVVLAIVALVRGGGIGGFIVGLIGGAVLGALLGALTVITFRPEVAAAIGVAVGLAVWPALMGLEAARGGVDFAGLKDRFWPDVTIDTTKETIEWVRRRTPLGPKS